MREKYGYAESSNIKATKAGHIYDVIEDGEALENGMPKVLGELDEILELRKVKKPEDKDQIVLVLSALVGEDDTTSTSAQEWYYRREDGQPARAYEIVPDDRFVIADYMIDALSDSVEEGNTITINSSPDGKKWYKEVAVASDAETAKQFGFMARIERVEAKGELTIVRLRTIKNTPISA